MGHCLHLQLYMSTINKFLGKIIFMKFYLIKSKYFKNYKIIPYLVNNYKVDLNTKNSKMGKIQVNPRNLESP